MDLTSIILQELLDTSSSSEDSDSDTEMYAQLVDILVQPQKRNTIRNFVEEVVPLYSEKEFVTHFRISRQLMTNLTEQFAESNIYTKLILPGNTRASITPEKHMLAFLWFSGHQTASFRDVADRFDLSISSLHDVITRAIDFFSSMAERVIRWPTPQEKTHTMNYYQETKGFPNVIGSIDGSHIQIDKPMERGDDYINRHNYPSMVLQGICNEHKKFIDVFIGYPGSVHDARVFQNATITPTLHTLCEGGYLLGDSAYKLYDILLTPYRDNGHLTAVQKYFNTKLSTVRISIEHTFGMLKQRFRQLYHLKLKGHLRICHFIRACCVLHNLADQDDFEAFNGELYPYDNQPENEEMEDVGLDGSELRDEKARQIFMRRGHE